LQTHFTYARPGLRRRLVRLGGRVYVALTLATLWPLSAGSWSHDTLRVIAGLVLGSFVAFWLAGLWVDLPRGHQGVATLDGDTVNLHGNGVRYTLPADQLREGSVRGGTAGWWLRLQDHHGDTYTLKMPDEATATQWLDVLGLDASRRAMRVVSNRTVRQWVFAYFLGGFFALPFLMSAGVLLALLGLLGVDLPGDNVFVVYLLSIAPGYRLAARAIGRLDISVGADGVRVGRRFIPIARVTNATVVGSSLHLQRSDGLADIYRFQDFEDAVAVARRIHAVVALHHSPSDTLPTALASTEALTATQWRDRFVHALRAEGYRAAAFTRDDLERLLRAKNVPAPQRLGAALALQAIAPTEALTGVRIAAEAMVDPKLPGVLADDATRDAATRAATG